MDEEAETWISKPIPALHNRSVLNLINEEGVRKTAEFVLTVGSKLGVPYTLNVPLEFS